VNKLAALVFLNPNDVSQGIEDIYDPLTEMMHPIINYFEDTYVGRC
jgi:hypothetical protein